MMIPHNPDNDNTKNTRTFAVLNERHCHYCGKRVEPELLLPSKTEPGVVYYAGYTCDCPEAKEELALKEELNAINKGLETLMDRGIGDQGRMLIRARAMRDQADEEIKALESAMQEGNP